MNKTQPYDVFIDNGILRNTLSAKAKKKSENFKNDLNRQILLTGSKNAMIISTPIMLVEYAGLLLRPLSTEESIRGKIKNIFNSIPFDTSFVIEEILTLFKSEIKSHDISNYENLKKRIIDQRAYQSELGKTIVDSSFLGNLEVLATRSRFIDEFCLDELQGCNFREVYGYVEEDDRISKLNAGLSAFVIHPTFNVAMSRMVNKFLNATEIGSVRNEVNSFDFDFSEKHHDRLDTQLIHFACVGNKRNGLIYPTLCFTNENWERVTKRITAYLKYIIHLSDENSTFKPKPGKIFRICQDSGSIKNELNVKDLWNDLVKKPANTF